MKATDDELESLKKQVAGLPRNAGGHRQYPDGVKRAILSLVDRHISAGGSRVEIAKALRMHSSTMAFWIKDSKKNRRIRQVTVAESAGPAAGAFTPAVFSCGVVRVERLTLAHVAELLKALS